MAQETITDGNLYFRDIVTNEKVIKKVGSEGTIIHFKINIVDKDSADAEKMFRYLSYAPTIKINYEEGEY